MSGYSDERRAYKRDQMRARRKRGRTVVIDTDTVNEERRELCRFDFGRFCRTYLSQAFPLDWSDDHLLAIDRIQESVLNGGLFAMAMPRGRGKTTLICAAAQWAILYGHKQWVCLIGSTSGSAESLLNGIKTDLTYNVAFWEDFPLACQPISELENDGRKCGGQLLVRSDDPDGDPVSSEVQWKTDSIVFPTVNGSESAGSRISVAGLTGNIRGQRAVQTDGTVIRPDLVLIDDPQTKQSAESPGQNEKRQSLINGDVLGLAGPNKQISGLLTCTVIAEDDLADRILDPKRSPAWRSIRCKLMKEMPFDTVLWDQYAEKRAEDLEAGGDGSKATEFYRENQAAMDKGAHHTWPIAFPDKYHSAIEHAMVIKIDRPEAFACEYQNEPLQPEGLAMRIEVAKAMRRIDNTVARMGAGVGSQTVTVGIDIQEKCLYWAAVAWDEKFGGTIVGYGAYPEQPRRYFKMTSITKTLEKKYPGMSLEARLFHGLSDLVTELTEAEFVAPNGNTVTVGRIILDAGWHESAPAVYRLCREHPAKAILRPAFGRGVKATEKPLSTWPKKKGDIKGYNWRERSNPDEGIRFLAWDANAWKSDLYRRLLRDEHDPGAIRLYEVPSPERHRMICEHLAAEHATKVEANGREVHEFKTLPGKPDNHLLDCLAMAAVGANHYGIKTGNEVARRGGRKKGRGVKYI